MTGISKLTFAKRVFEMDENPTSLGRRPMLRPGQKPVAMMRATVRNYSKPRVLVLDLRLGTGATAKACLLELKHGKFACCNADITCMAKMMPSLLKVFAEQVMNPESDIEDGEYFQKVARDILCSSTCAVEKRRRNVSQVPKGMTGTQTFPKHITLYISQYHPDMKLDEKAQHLPCSLWSEKWLSRLHSMDERALLSHESGIHGMKLKPSTIQHGCGLG